MKVISGIYKGRNLKGFNIDGTRPTMDRVKESLFASISGYIDNANILDLFCGSGALGIEALSNGGKWCDFCDNNREVIKVVKDNINGLGIRNCEIYKMDYRDMLKRIKLMGSKYDIVFLDPPYNKRVINDIIYTLIMDDMVNEEGLIVIEHSGNYEYIDYDGLVVIKDKKYGDKFITILQKVIDN